MTTKRIVIMYAAGAVPCAPRHLAGRLRRGYLDRFAPDARARKPSAMISRRSGDGFMRCGDGHVRWGVYGAAGVLFVVRDGEHAFVMLQKRSAFAHEGGTWSCAGGALDEHEGPVDGALREASEEIGEVPAEHRLIGQYVFSPADDWSYTTVVVEVEQRFGESMNFETDAVDWVHTKAVDSRPLHAGFAAAWPHLRAIIDTRSG